MSEEKECRVCNGGRHRWDKDRGCYVPCICLKAKRRVERYRAADIPSRYDPETWRTWADTYTATNGRVILGAAKILAQGNQPKEWVMVHGHPTVARSLASALLLRSACDGDFDARGVDVPSLIDAEFQPGRGSELYHLPVLSIEVGGEPANKWNRVVLEKLLHQRWERSLFTLFVVNGDPARIGAGYKSASIASGFTEKFRRVRVAPKGDE